MTVKKKKNNVWRIGLITLVLIVLAGVLVVPRLLGVNKAKAASNIKTTAAETGTIEKTVTGTGNLSTEDTLENIVVPDGIELDEVLVEAGDVVKQGDALATLDPVALQTAIWDTQDELNSLDAQLNGIKGTNESKVIRAAISGRVKQILVKEGDAVEQVMTDSGALLMLSIDGKMAVEFAPQTTDGLAAGDEVVATLPDGKEIEARIESISTDRCVVTMTDNGPKVDEQVSIALKDDTLLGSGTLKISKPIAITGTSGVVKDIIPGLNALVSNGSSLIELETAPASREYEALYANRLDAADRMNTLLKYAQTNTIIAPFTGELQAVNVKDGQQTGSGSTASSADKAAAGTTPTGAYASSTAQSSAAAATTFGDESAAFTIKTDSTLYITAAIDEMDILSLAVGQTARITLDALPDGEYEGVITEISDIGLVSQGVTTFDVKISVTSDEAMRVGMNTTATIIIEKREGIVRIPLEALQELGNEQFVYVGTPTDEENLGEKRMVKIGISDGEYVEITEGLSAGEHINYIYTSGSDTGLNMPFGGRFEGNGGNASGAGDAGLGQ